MPVRDTACLAGRRFAASDAFRRHLLTRSGARRGARERKRECRDQIAARCPGWRTRWTTTISSHLPPLLTMPESSFNSETHPRPRASA